MGEQLTIEPFAISMEKWKSLGASELQDYERVVLDRHNAEIAEGFKKGFKTVVVSDGKVLLQSREEMTPQEVDAAFPNRPHYMFIAPPVIFIEKPSTMEEYVKFIQEQSTRKGWSKERQWLWSSVVKEHVELVKAIEANKSDEDVGLEFADVLYFLFQYVKAVRPNVNLDLSLLAKMKDNEVKKKKTIDEDGNIVRK